MADTPSLERRQTARVPIVIPVELADERGFSVHSSSDLSVGGAYFARAIPHPVGSRVRVTLRLPQEAPIACDGVIASVPDTHEFGMGVRFVGLSGQDRQRLEALIRTQEVGP